MYFISGKGSAKEDEILVPLQLKKEMPTVSETNLDFKKNGVLDGKPPYLHKALWYRKGNKAISFDKDDGILSVAMQGRGDSIKAMRFGMRVGATPWEQFLTASFSYSNEVWENPIGVYNGGHILNGDMGGWQETEATYEEEDPYGAGGVCCSRSGGVGLTLNSTQIGPNTPISYSTYKIMLPASEYAKLTPDPYSLTTFHLTVTMSGQPQLWDGVPDDGARYRGVSVELCNGSEGRGISVGTGGVYLFPPHGTGYHETDNADGGLHNGTTEFIFDWQNCISGLSAGDHYLVVTVVTYLYVQLVVHEMKWDNAGGWATTTESATTTEEVGGEP